MHRKAYRPKQIRTRSTSPCLLARRARKSWHRGHSGLVVLFSVTARERGRKRTFIPRRSRQSHRARASRQAAQRPLAPRKAAGRPSPVTHVASEVATPLPPIEDAELIADLAPLVKRWIAGSRSA